MADLPCQVTDRVTGETFRRGEAGHLKTEVNSLRDKVSELEKKVQELQSENYELREQLFYQVMQVWSGIRHPQSLLANKKHLPGRRYRRTS